jgi:hypothetical protein
MGQGVPLDTQPLTASGHMPPEFVGPARGVGTLVKDMRPSGLVKRARIVRTARGLTRALKLGFRTLAAKGAVKSEHP